STGKRSKASLIDSCSFAELNNIPEAIPWPLFLCNVRDVCTLKGLNADAWESLSVLLLRLLGRNRPSVLILVGLKLTAVDVILVDLNKRVPLLRQIGLCEDCRHRTDWHTGPAVNALGGVDVQVRHLIERRSAIVIDPALRRMDTIHRAHIHAGGVLCSDAG